MKPGKCEFCHFSEIRAYFFAGIGFVSVLLIMPLIARLLTLTMPLIVPLSLFRQEARSGAQMSVDDV